MKAVALQSSEAKASVKKQKSQANAVPVSPWFHQNVSINQGLIQRKADCACGGGCPRCAGGSHQLDVQTKLTVSTPGDQYEQEADRVSEQVMRMPESGNTASVPVVGRFSNRQPQQKCADAQPSASHEDEEYLQPKEIAGERPTLATKTQSQIDALTGGGGQPLPSSLRAFFEPRFGYSFDSVRVHADARAAESAQAVKAQAYTVGRDIVFGEGQYTPGTTQGRLLLAHELTHVVQQSGASSTLQRQHVADTGFRYTPPATVKRSIVEIQGIVATTPDGVYGENTRIEVERYQTKLKAIGFYKDTLDGKWGNNTEAAHVNFATTDTLERRGYNCTGFALKDYIFRGLTSTKAVYAKMTKLADCSKPCSPYFHKFWIWDYDLKQVNTKTGTSSTSIRDFHTVGGQTDGKGNDPAQVMSKNGKRPVEGPKPPMDWKPVTAQTTDGITGLPLPDTQTVRTGHVEQCFCNDKLP